MDMNALLMTMVIVGMLHRTAVSTSSPTVLKARSPITLMHSLSGSANLAPMARPKL